MRKASRFVGGLIAGGVALFVTAACMSQSTDDGAGSCGSTTCVSGSSCCDGKSCVPSNAFCCGNGTGAICPKGYWCCPGGCCKGSPTGSPNTGACPSAAPIPCSAGWCCPYGDGDRTDVCCNQNAQSTGCTKNGICSAGSSSGAPGGGSSTAGGCGTTMGCCPATGCGTGWFNSCWGLCFPTSNDCGQATQEAFAAGMGDSCSCRQCY
jgi:hypothetical protein